MPIWVGVVSALSLAVLALCALAIAAISLAAAQRAGKFLALFEALATPAVGDARSLIATVRGEVEGIVGTSRDLRARVLRAADAAEVRLGDLEALLDVIQEEVESTTIDLAATFRDLRRGANLVEWGKKVLARPKRKKGRKR